MAKQVKQPGIERTFLFDANTVTRKELIELMSKYHRGDTGLCDTIVGLMIEIAKLRGFAPIRLTELEPNRTHAWCIVAHDTKVDVWEKGPYATDATDELIDFMDVRGQGKYIGLHYMGKRPQPEDVAKKIREIGARSFG